MINIDLGGGSFKCCSQIGEPCAGPTQCCNNDCDDTVNRCGGTFCQEVLV